MGPLRVGMKNVKIEDDELQSIVSSGEDHEAVLKYDLALSAVI